jgi:hypothetical protein
MADRYGVLHIESTGAGTTTQVYVQWGDDKVHLPCISAVVHLEYGQRNRAELLVDNVHCELDLLPTEVTVNVLPKPELPWLGEQGPETLYPAPEGTVTPHQ